MLAELQEVCGHKPFAISAVTGDGLMPLVRRTFKVIEHIKALESDNEEEPEDVS
ncbi:MAG: hypothetical protein ACJARS_003806 [bacterium]|jgi:hypothetical protein